jgi:hypothetical protein
MEKWAGYNRASSTITMKECSYSVLVSLLLNARIDDTRPVVPRRSKPSH